MGKILQRASVEKIENFPKVRRKGASSLVRKVEAESASDWALNT